LIIYSEHSWWWLIVILVFSFGIAYFQYYFKNTSTVFSKNIRALLFSIRVILLFILGLLLLNLYSKITKNEYIKPVLLIAIDNSQSMKSAKDSSEVLAFIQKQFPELVEGFKDKMDVQVISFGENIHFNPEKITLNELKTNAENIWNVIHQTLGNRPISALILISDGIFNEGIHPISLAQTLDYPVYVIGTGDTTIYKDIAIKKILHNNSVFIGNDFIAEVLIKSSGVKQEKIKVSISENNQEISNKEILINSDKQDLTSVSFQLPANKGGHHTYKVQTTILKDEKNTHNNTAYFVVNVIENKTKVLFLYSAPHPDISAIRQVLHSSEQYETDVFSESSLNQDIYKYDVIVYHSPDVNSPLFNKCWASSIPMFVISNNVSALNNKLLSVKQYLPQQSNEIECYFNSNFSAFSITEEDASLSQQSPIILAPYGNYSPLGESEILYFQKINNVLTDLPLMYVTSTTQGKYAVFLGDGLWKWKMTNYQLKQNHEWFSHLITQTFRYLSIKRDKSPFKVFIPATINENEPLHVRAEFLNETMQNSTEPDVFLKLEDASKREYKYVFNKSTSYYFLNAGNLPAGEYTYTAYTQYKGKDYKQMGKVHILPLSIEQNNLVAQHSLLKALANKTGGKFYTLDKYQAIYEDIQKDENIKTIITQQDTYQYWIDNKYIFALIVLLATLEWAIRRWNGVI